MELPSYPNLRKICFEDKDFLEQTFKVYEPKISEYTFTDIFIYRKKYKTLISKIDATILVMIHKPDLNQNCFLPPLGSKKIVDIVEEMLSITRRKDILSFYGLDKFQAESLKKKGFNIKEARNDWDYVYLVSDLISLPGERYYTKRKNIKKCIDRYKPEYKPITREDINQCLDMQTNWCNLRNCDAIPGLEAEHKAIKETFLHFSELNVFGSIFLVNGNVEAFTIGERLNRDTAVIHFEKANHTITGLYQVINQWFCSNALQDFKYVNREQDLGISGLRRAKMSYHPAFLVEKYLATHYSSESSISNISN